jgi:hypothetical protein
MGARSTKMMANISVDHMNKIKFIPKCILNIGIGSCPELWVWRNRLPDISLFGIDIRHGRWNAPYIHAVVGSVDGGKVSFCSTCKSLKCEDVNHRKANVDSRTIDSIVNEKRLDGPYFMWIDIEGGELDALKGAEKTLSQVPLISIEMREFAWTKNYCEELNNFLKEIGYFKVDYGKTPWPLEDQLYQRVDYKFNGI